MVKIFLSKDMVEVHVKAGIFRILSHLLCCAMVLLPVDASAGTLNIPGFNGPVIKAPTVQAPATQSLPVNIPGFYGPTVAPPPPQTLPELKDGGALQGATVAQTSQNQLTIQQNQQQAIIDWSHFNISADSTVQFLQQGKDQQGNAWVGSALNRIWSNSPSLIFGKLSADGKIYLINQNGILFGPGSQVNVNSLTASALNITNENFINNIFQFRHEDYNGTGLDPLAAVSNHGEINAVDGGYIFLMAPRVENIGSINAPIGQIGLVAGTDVTLLSPGLNDTSRSGFYVIINNDFSKPGSDDPTFGNAVNREHGSLTADGGVAGMYGNNVDQWGIIRSITAFRNRQGQVELRASNKVTTYAGSTISLPVNPSTTDTVSDTFDIQPLVDIGGLHQPTASGVAAPAPVKQIELNGAIQAPTGRVTLNAGERVYVGETGSIDVSGVVADLPAALLTDFKLTSVELRDDYEQKGGVLQGQKITTPLLSGSAIGDVSQAILTRDKTALERSIGGDIRKVIDPTTGASSYGTQSGQINITAANGDVIVKHGAVIDFSGGAINYQSGFVDTTKLLAGATIYDISNAPASLHYDSILGDYSKVYSRFGIIETYSGLYYGGAAPLKTYVNSYTQGGDAGVLQLSASHIVLDGQLKGGVTGGTYQNTWTSRGSYANDTDYYDALMLSKARGLEAPRAGTLTMGNDNPFTNPASNITAISVVSDFQPSQLGPDSPLQTGPTMLSAKTLNDANLGTIRLYADLTVSTAQDVSLSLQPGGTFSASARRIEHAGQIKVPAGTIGMFIWQDPASQEDQNGFNRTTDQGYVPLQERIVLESGSRLDVSGERIDNSMVGKTGSATLKSGQTKGGTVTIMDETDLGKGVFMQEKAVVDVSGGYVIDQSGKVTGGNAGALSIQGSNIMLDGELRGYALSDASGKIAGGSVTLASTNIGVASLMPAWYSWSGFDPLSSPVPEAMKGKFILDGGRLDDTGITSITLKSFNDVVVQPNTVIAPSLVRLNNPSSAAQTGSAASEAGSSGVPGQQDLIRIDNSMAFTAGPSSFTAIASSPFLGAAPKFTGNLLESGNPDAKVVISAGSVIQTVPAASSATNISLRAPVVDIAGDLVSPGGNISVNATVGSLTVEKGAGIRAGGYNLPDPATTPKGFSINYKPVSGGNVALSASAIGGDLIINQGSLIDVSGSDAVLNRALSSGAVFTYKEAGNPGSLSLTYFRNLTLDGSVSAKAKMDGVQGAALTVSRTDTLNGMEVRAADVIMYRDMGFDDLTLKSLNSLKFIAPMDVTIGRKLTLDAPIIQGVGQAVTLKAPWILLTNSNSSSSLSPITTATPAGGALTLSGQWLDVIGFTQFNGFQNVALDAVRDIRLSEALYNTGSGGALVTAGNLSMDADRIYPGNSYSFRDGGNIIQPSFYSDYTLQVGGKVTIMNTGPSVGGPIYSAGGSLTVNGLGGIDIEKGGTIAAPMGAITLSAPGKRIYIADGSVVTTAGDIPVNYGLIDSSNIWVEQNSTPFDGSSLSQKGITINAGTGETIVMSGAKIDVSGGGSLFAYQFQPSIQGSTNPLTKSGSYVVFKDNSFQMPATEVYLNGGGGLSRGVYTLIPLANHPENERYAFMPGAYIIQAQTTGASLPQQGSLSTDGYPLTVGYTAVADTSIRGTQPLVYSVRPAADLLAEEGNYVKPAPLISGNAGDISIKGNSTIINGDLHAAPLSDSYTGGTISLSGKNVIVQSSAATQLPSNFGFGTSLDSTADLSKLKGTLTVTADSISGKGFQEVSLGDKNTDTITIKNDPSSLTVLSAAGISLAANTKITIEAGAQLQALAQTGFGEIDLNSPAGTAVIGQGALLHASHAINLNVGIQNIQGDLQVDHSALTLKGAEIFFVPDTYTGSKQSGLYITDSMWSKYSAIGDITLDAGSTDPSTHRSVAGEIQFMESFNLSAANSLTLDASRILYAGAGSSVTAVTLSAPTVSLRNSGPSSAFPGSAGAGTFTVGNSSVVKQINIGGGDVLFSGFKTITLNSYGDVTLLGKGSLTTGNAELVINAARVTTGSTTGATVTNPDSTTSSPITAAKFVVYTGADYYNDQNNLIPANAITIGTSGGTPGKSSTPGGMLEFWGSTIAINQGGVIQMDGGSIKLVATGAGPTDGIFMHDGAQILARGTDDAPGGWVALRADNGSIGLDANSLIDVSGKQLDASSIVNVATQLDAGSVTLLAPVGGVSINGNLKGTAGTGKDSLGNMVSGAGGSFVLDTLTVDTDYINTNKLNVTDMTKLIGTLTAGGFTESLDIRARSGNVDISPGHTLTASHVKLTADGGEINVYQDGTIDANASPNAGTVEIYANNDLNIGGKILAKGTTKGEEDVVLSSANGFVNLRDTGLIDVSGNGAGQGVVHLRAQQQNGNDVQMNLDGTIKGASAVYAEAFMVYDNVSTIDQNNITTWQTDTKTYMANSDTIKSRLLASLQSADAGNFHLVPGIEARSDGDIILNTAWDLSSITNGQYDWRYGGEPGVLTIRASGNLSVNSDLVDHPTDMDRLIAAPAARNSWAFNLAAGADTSSANYMSVNNGKGNFSIADAKVVYTESAPIRFASGNDTLISSGAHPNYMINASLGYNLASYSGSIEGWVGRDLVITGGAVQTATGDIDINIARDLNINFGSGYLGAVRTTGQAPVGPPLTGDPTPTTYDPNYPSSYDPRNDYWRYAGGGNITLNVGRYAGTFNSSSGWVTALSRDSWDYFTPITVALPSGDSIEYKQFSANYAYGTSGLATMGGGNLAVRTGGDFLAQAGTFGAGDLRVYSGGNIEGRFLNMNGQGVLLAMGNFGNADARQQIELFNSRMTVTALGDIQIGAILNPSLASDQVQNDRVSSFVNCTYTQDTAISLNAGGDVTIAGKSPFYLNTYPIYETILPATLNVEAAGSIYLLNNLTLTSSPTGNLRLLARGGDISGSFLDTSRNVHTASILMSDIAPEYWYGLLNIYGNIAEENNNWINNRTHNFHGFYKPEDSARQANAGPLHQGDPQAIEIGAGGNIESLKLALPKKAEVTAGADILDIVYEGQNIDPADVSVIRAGGNISMKYATASPTASADIQPHNGFIQGGPGVFLVQAGGSIDLGSLQDGIQAIGNGSNPALGTGKSTLVVVSGYGFDKTAGDISVFFDAIRKAGDDYATLSAEGKLNDASTLLQDTRANTIKTFLGTPSGAGDIDMTSSQIATSIGQSDIYVIANGNLNLGKTSLPVSGSTNTKTGITTGGGGGINIFARKDINVEESRIMTFYGGDLTVWSDEGNINAGRGSRTAVSASPPRKVPTAVPGVYATVFTPPAVGSGIRAVTFGDNPPPPGNIHLFAPSGIIDAGEAGISGGQIILAAVQVLNASNISFTSGSVGVPLPSEGTAGIGTLSGAGAVTAAATQFSQDTAGIAATRAVQGSQMIEDIIAKWLDVKVIDFVQDDKQEGEKEKE